MNNIPQLSDDTEIQQELCIYLDQMDETHKKAYLIAKEHLGTSFNVFKSNGYKEWKKKQIINK